MCEQQGGDAISLPPAGGDGLCEMTLNYVQILKKSYRDLNAQPVPKISCEYALNDLSSLRPRLSRENVL